MADYNIIYTYGGGEVLEHVFNGIALVLGSGKTSLISQMLKLAAILGGFAATISMIISLRPFTGIKWFAWFLFVSEVLLIPTVPVWIKDPVTRYERHVENVPFGHAFVAGKISQIGHILTQEMEQNFTPVNDYMYHKTGFVFGSRLISNMSKIRITNADFAQTMHNFVAQCVIIPAMIGQKYTIEELRHSKDIWTLVKNNAPKLMMFSYKNPNESTKPRLMSCKQGVIEIEKTLKIEERKAMMNFAKIAVPDLFLKMIGKSTGNMSRSSESQLRGYLNTAFTSYAEISDSAEKAIRQQMVINAITDGAAIKGGSLGVSSYAMAKAKLQQENTYGILGMLRDNLPAIKAVMEAIIYGSFIFIALIALMIGGHRILITYLQTLAWLQLWAPLNAILNLCITLYAKNQTANLLAGKGLTLANSAGLIELHETMHAYAQGLSWSIPFISIAIIKGVSSFVHLASHLTAGTQAAAASTAGEITSGNISMGNIQHRVRAMENMTAFQTNTSMSRDTGSHSRVMEDGTLERITPNGNTIYTAGVGRTISRFGTGINASNVLSSSLQNSMNQEQSMIEANSKEYSMQQSEAQRSTADLLDKISNGMSSGENYGLDKSTTAGKAINDAVNLQNQLQERFGMTSSQASKVVAGVSANAGMGGSKNGLLGILSKAVNWNVGFNAGFNYDSATSREQAISDMAQMVTDSGYSQTLDSLSKATKGMTFNENQSQEQALSTSLHASSDKMRSLREANSVSQQNIDRYSQAKSYVESNSISINENVDQKFLEYLSTREQHGKQIGLNTARKMIDGGFPESKMYMQYFIRDVLQPEALQVSQSVSQGQGSIASKYNSVQPQQTEMTNNLKSQGLVETIVQAGNKMITPVQNRHLKTDVRNQIRNADAQVKQRQMQNTSGREKTQSQADKKYDKWTLPQAVKNVWTPDKKKTLDKVGK